MKLFSTSEISTIDSYTIKYEPISAIDLMERASLRVADYIVNETDFDGKVYVFCGPGNNGGDGLAVARMLSVIEERFQVSVFIQKFSKELEGSSAINLNRLIQQNKAQIHFLIENIELPEITKDVLLIDALFGSGLNRKLEGFPAKIVDHLNQSNAEIISIDIPSGLMGEENSASTKSIIKATQTITFQFPKISFLFPENEKFVGIWKVKNIGLHPQIIEETPTNYYYTDDSSIREMIKPRSRFSHKGTFGHALLISGSYGKMGAAVLGTRACLRSGVGLITTHVPHTGYQIIQTAVPEAMTSIDESDLMFTDAMNLENYNAIGIGPGIGQKSNTQKGLLKLIQQAKTPLLLDADSLNILSMNKEWLSLLPKNSILTPHPKEFERLAGTSENSFQRLKKAVEMANKYQCIIVLKGANTAVINSIGDVWFNSTGNAGMATAGSGDVLTGIILGLIAQNYEPMNAAILGVYIHGLAGDIAAARRGYEALIASDIIENLGEAFKLAHK